MSSRRYRNAELTLTFQGFPDSSAVFFHTSLHLLCLRSSTDPYRPFSQASLIFWSPSCHVEHFLESLKRPRLRCVIVFETERGIDGQDRDDQLF